jgi:proteasome accessory factor C
VTTTAADQLNRIVSVVAELSRREREGEPAATLSELAASHATTPEQIGADIRTLTLLGDDPDADWLLSLAVWQQGEEVHVSSSGPYRRPVRFTPEELMAVQLGLAAEDAMSTALSCELAGVLGAGTGAVSEPLSGPPVAVPAAAARPDVFDLLLRAVDECRRVELLYAGEGATKETARVIQPHQVVSYEGRGYIVAWCERAKGWRNFRADRVIDARFADGEFEVRDDFEPVTDPSRVFSAPEDGLDEVEVRFSPDIARWILELHPDARSESDGSAVVTYRVASLDWLVRRVLQYGPEAEVLGPEVYREGVRWALV